MVLKSTVNGENTVLLTDMVTADKEKNMRVLEESETLESGSGMKAAMVHETVKKGRNV